MYRINKFTELTNAVNILYFLNADSSRQILTISHPISNTFCSLKEIDSIGRLKFNTTYHLFKFATKKKNKGSDTIE